MAGLGYKVGIHEKMIAVEKLLLDRPAPSVEAAEAPAVGGERLNEEERCLLCRSPVVTNDAQWAELEDVLVHSGQYGPFFDALVRTIRARIIDKSDVHKTANATLRSLMAEPTWPNVLRRLDTPNIG